MSHFSHDLCIATFNKGKLVEFQSLLPHATLLPISHFTDNAPDETGLTFIENALLKARHASIHSNLPALADDSGLVIPYLNGEPGIYSARYADNHTLAMDKILDSLESCDEKDRVAYFYCAIAFLKHPTDPTPIIGLGTLKGVIAHEKLGDGGFGYDPIFYIPERNKTLAALSKDEKNAISHRYHAINHFLQQLS